MPQSPMLLQPGNAFSLSQSEQNFPNYDYRASALNCVTGLGKISERANF
jgi:hypothetical protein